MQVNGYNNAAQPASVVDVAHNINFFSSATYAPPGLLTGANHGATTGWTGVTLANSYNSRLQPTELKATSPVPLTLLDLTYSYDQGSGKNNGDVVQIANLRDSTRTVNYTYDQLNRLSKAETTAATWGDSYTYDNWGNLLAKTVTKGSAENLLPLAVDSGNHITTSGFHYDLAGNMTSDGSNGMTYDAENRRNPTSGSTFTYDGDGRRVAKSDGSVYWVDDNFRPLSLGTNTGSISKDFVFLGSKRIAMVAISSGNPYYYLSDHLGSTAVISSGDGKAVQWEADYYTFGNQRQVFTNLVSNVYQFTGYEYDSGSGYNYAVARFEAGRWSRFLSPDPYLGSMDLKNPQSLNRYAYVDNDPVNRVDPLGLVSPGCDDYFSCIDGPFEPVGDRNDGGLSTGDGPGGNGGGGSSSTANNGPPCLVGAGPLAPGQSRCAGKPPCANSTLSAAGVNAQEQIAMAQGAIASGEAAGSAAPYGNPITGFVAGMFAYYEVVHTEGPNDIKNLPGHSPKNPVDVAAGNISFGITCPYGAGFCQFAAGFAQTLSGHPSPNGTLATGFDTPSDNAAILVGQAMRAAGCHE